MESFVWLLSMTQQVCLHSSKALDAYSAVVSSYIGYPDRVLCEFSQYSKARALIVSQLGNDCLLWNSFQFIIHVLSIRLMFFILTTKIIIKQSALQFLYVHMLQSMDKILWCLSICGRSKDKSQKLKSKAVWSWTLSLFVGAFIVQGSRNLIWGLQVI
jgi:hypothetical protein